MRLNPPATQEEWDGLEPQANHIFQAARHSQYAHNAEAQNLSAKNQVMGISAAILAAISGATALGHLSGVSGFESHRAMIETGQGLIALSAALISTLQTRLNYSKLAELHRHAAVEYGAARRNLKTMFHMPLRSRDDPREYFDGLQGELHALANKSPQISGSVWTATEQRLQGDPSPLMGL